jgi:hypothetical protein
MLRDKIGKAINTATNTTAKKRSLIDSPSPSVKVTHRINLIRLLE